MELVDDTMPIAELLDERRHLLEVAHGLLGSVIAAERVIDEAYREWYGLCVHQRARIMTPRAWLTRAVSGIALLLRTWDTLSPAEQAAFGRDDVEGTVADTEAYAIAGTAEGSAGQSEPACTEPGCTRPAGTGPDGCDPGGGASTDRALHSLRARRARPAPPRRQDEIAHAVRQSCADGDTDRLASLLAPDACAFFDGGGKVRTLARPVTGRERVARSLLTLLARHPRTTLRTCPVNGRTGLVARCDGQVAAVVGLDVAGSRVVQVWAVLNPDKLRSWNRPRP
ncbi:RNA polymerase subunit sigma [Streptomyces sp. NPDC059785]|uniref:RNA polymerase subunit sigma n=1 Tax=Streptomyces sp. NPDC059785 TaxID=3346945 RepID=UPI00364947B5